MFEIGSYYFFAGWKLRCWLWGFHNGSFGKSRIFYTFCLSHISLQLVKALNRIFWTDWSETSTRDVVYGKVLQCCWSRQNGARQHRCPRKFDFMPWTVVLCVLVLKEVNKWKINDVIWQLEKLEEETIKWCREILRNSPMAIRVAKSALNAVDDGHSGLQVPRSCPLPMQFDISSRILFHKYTLENA